MRREESVREHLKHLKWVLDSVRRCGCLRCLADHPVLHAQVKALEWALGDNDDIGGLVEQLAAAYARRGGMGGGGWACRPGPASTAVACARSSRGGSAQAATSGRA